MITVFSTVDATVFSSSPTSETDSSGKPRYQGRILIAMVFSIQGAYKARAILHQVILFGNSKANILFDSVSL